MTMPRRRALALAPLRPADEPPPSLAAEAITRTALSSPTRSAVQEKLDWLDSVAADHEVNTTTFKVAFVVAQHINSRSREAWPKQQRVARLVGVSETTVRGSLRTLVNRGHLEQGKKGARNLNKYRLSQSAGGIHNG